MEKCQKMDPFNLDYVDTYSNVLYVKGKQPELSILAQHVFELDRYRPESCNVIGNFYSLRGEREKAISYFNRAVRLDPHYLSAWTLLGHEYIELKNWNAAIAAYRRAVDIGPKDYR
jgi:anaphase-promoting complex subunit 8